jgi:hypothetical protein
LTGDANPADNYLTKTVENYDCLITLPWTEGFEGADPLTERCWNFIDYDGDGYNWWHVPGYPQYAHSGNNFMASDSYINQLSRALTPNNYMILPPFVVPEKGADIEFWVKSFHSAPERYNEAYKVLVSTTRPTPENFVSLYEETLHSDQWQKRLLGLDAATYAGQQVFIAIVHTNCTAQYMLCIDDISIKETETPVITNFAIDNGAAVTPYQTVSLDMTYSATPPVEYIASENPDFNGAIWTVMTSTPLHTFDVNENGIKTVYIKIRNGAGESAVFSDDIYYKHGPMKITDYTINNGGASTIKREVVLNHTVIDGKPVYYSASENQALIGNEWLPYINNPVFTLSEGKGTKTVYFAVSDESKEDISNIVSDDIVLDQSETVEHHGLDVKLYPNPAENEINVLIENDLSAKVQVSVYTTMGQICYSGEYESARFTIDLSSCPSGVLLVKLSSADKYVVKRVIKL